MGIDLSAKMAVFLATFVGAAAAFNGAAMRPMRGSRSSASTMAVEDLVGGINDPIGQILGPMDSVWDPLGLGADEASLYRRRVVEIKHGRVCMVAFLGMTVGPNDLITPSHALLSPSLDLHFDDIPGGTAGLGAGHVRAALLHYRPLQVIHQAVNSLLWQRQWTGGCCRTAWVSKAFVFLVQSRIFSRVGLATVHEYPHAQLF